MIDISSKSKDLRVSRLSNFTERHFQFSGFECVSVESLLQALKTGNLSEQQMVCLLDGRAAKSWGLKQVAWKSDLMLWWDTHQIGRLTRRYQQLLTSVYDAVFKCDARCKLQDRSTCNWSRRHLPFDWQSRPSRDRTNRGGNDSST